MKTQEIQPCSNCGKTPVFESDTQYFILICKDCEAKYLGTGAWFSTFPWSKKTDAVNEWNNAVSIKNGLSHRNSILLGLFMDDDFFTNLGFTYPKPMFQTGRILPEHCLFSSSWDWLMPVLEKVLKLEIDKEYITLRTFGALNTETGQVMVRFNRFPLCQADSLLEATYLAIVGVLEFIEQQNRNNAGENLANGFRE
jgi:hypothetical protein